MRIPAEVSLNLKKYEKFQDEEKLLEELEKHPHELLSFFLVACEDETWAESHDNIMRGMIHWLTDANLNRNFPHDFFNQVISSIQKHIDILKPFIPMNLCIRNGQTDYFVNSMMLGIQSHYFRRRIINECRGMKNPLIKIDQIPDNIIEFIDEFIYTGEVINLWRVPQEELWKMIDYLTPLGLFSIIELCQQVLRRYINRNNVFDMLITAHQKFLQLLQNACIEFINGLDLGMRLFITPVEFLSFEFLDYKERAMEVYDRLVSEITHLVFSHEMASNANFKTVINNSPKLIGLDLSDTTGASDYLSDLPDRLQELHLSRCQWISNATLQTLSTVCPKLSRLDLSSNDHLTYALWSVLQKFKKLSVLDLSYCSQIGDNELRIILQAVPQLVDLKLIDCQKITSNGFFEIGKFLPNLSILNIARTTITDAALIDIMSRCKNLYSIDLSRCYAISIKGVLEGIRNCLELKIIHIYNSGLTASDMDLIKKNNPYLTILA